MASQFLKNTSAETRSKVLRKSASHLSYICVTVVKQDLVPIPFVKPLVEGWFDLVSVRIIFELTPRHYFITEDWPQESLPVRCDKLQPVKQVLRP